MARRLFMGNTHSENGWPYVDEGGCRWGVVPGTGDDDEAVHLQIQEAAFIPMMAFAADIHEFIHKLRDRDSCCFTLGNSVSTSNHPSGTAFDLNWDDHPFHARHTFTPAQEQELQRILQFYDGIIFWAGVDWWRKGWNGNPLDEMHFQMDYGTWDRVNDRVSPRVTEWIKKNIRPDGFSRYRRGDTPVVTESAATVLSHAAGIGIQKANEILATVQQGLALSGCDTVNEIAMWLAQMGHESASFVYTEEIAKNGRYAPYIGRTWIQITWDYNYRAFGQWCVKQGLITDPDQFIKNPVSLADIRWAGIGPAWYWTVQRPNIPAMAADGNLEGVTYAINGGYNGLEDRRTRYQRALAQGTKLLALIGQGDDMAQVPQDQWDRVYREQTQEHESLSPYRTPGEGKIGTWCTIDRNGDLMTHVMFVEHSAIEMGDFDSIERIFKAAKGLGAEKSPEFIKRAQAALKRLEAQNPDALTAYLTSKGVQL